MSPEDFHPALRPLWLPRVKRFSSGLIREWHFWINAGIAVIEQVMGSGWFSDGGKVYRVLGVVHVVLYLIAAYWQAPRASWSEEQKIAFFRSEVAAYDFRKLTESSK